MGLWKLCVTVLLFYHEAVGARKEETGTSIFQSACVEGIHSSGGVQSSQADCSYDDPSLVQALGVWGVVRAIYLLSYFVDSDYVSAKEEHYGSLGV